LNQSLSTIKVQTAQNVEIEYETASVSDRLLAYLLDIVFIMGYYAAVMLLYILVRKSLPDVHLGYIIGGVLLPILFYDLFFEVFYNGQSPGKRIRKIKVIRMDGRQPRIGHYLMRWVFRLIDIAFTYGGVAIAVILVGGKGQRLGDLAAGTVVISLKERAKLDHTIFTELSKTYEIQFPQVSQLEPKTVAVINEVLEIQLQGEAANVNKLKLLNKTKETLVEKLGVTTDLQAAEFLKIVLKDYNAINGKVEFG
jgi:uncharacterized RDD family membrane protein YckC